MSEQIDISTLTRTSNEALILAVISRGELHGYQIALKVEQASEGKISFNHGTLYPILHSLEKKGYITGRWEAGGPSRKRKYYSITEKGTKRLKQQHKGLQSLFDGVMSVLEGDENAEV